MKFLNYIDIKMDKDLWFTLVYNREATQENKERYLNNADSFVDVLRLNFAELINQMDWLKNDTESQDQKRLCSIAISKLEEACMFCVKAANFDIR